MYCIVLLWYFYYYIVVTAKKSNMDYTLLSCLKFYITLILYIKIQPYNFIDNYQTSTNIKLIKIN